ncbi:MAG: mechanosensitive ion channel family protein [Bacteroidales bacterium]|nr:mechanosensitive ion channel family protein [Bacteroidales bacterium]
MTKVVQWLDDILVGKMHLDPDLAGFLNTALLIVAIIFIGIGVNWICQSIFRWLSRHNLRLIRSKWHPFLAKRKIGHNILLLIPGIVVYFLPNIAFESGTKIIRLLHRLDITYMLIVMIMIGNSMLLAFLDFYSTTDKNRSRPLQGLVQGLQVILYFVGGIIMVAVLIDKSPTVLLTGLGASAAVLMLVFKDSILGFVAGVQLSQNDMIRLGDWIQMPDGSANGNVEEITLNTVKVRNWDNTLTMIPPYTLVTTPFKNWRGMQESGGRRADKNIYINLNTLEICSKDMISDIRKNVPAIDSYIKALPEDSVTEGTVTNIQLYRKYIEIYLSHHPDVNQSLDIIVTQKEATAYGVPIEVYFFTRDKAWAVYERKQSDIFDHLMAIVPEFGLQLYQRP